jgi:3-isopropylmalate/(R)-2-methylmalate dehydratase small subunit
MEPFKKLAAAAAPLDMANVDTDQIFPSRFLHKPRGTGFAKMAFHDVRFDKLGHENQKFVLNQAAYRNAKIIVSGANFGCGSSREAAVYALYDFGIRSVIAPSFGDIHYANQLQNGMLPVVLPEEICAKLRGQLHGMPGVPITVDLESQTVTGPDKATYHFDINQSHRERLLKGLDEVGLILRHVNEIEAFERRHYRELPWIS